ncbi:hypothetical protein GCM10011369_12950 [Neiella marina]|uniref:Uncharacterized protein n=1 Tax=Neiella marina TaxID=508461 RepID=A0A8J2XNZ6_9GAMM|nr:hypothetical protein GCM10011369_12950 [Neiella marina]
MNDQYTELQQNQFICIQAKYGWRTPMDSNKKKALDAALGQIERQ